MRGSIPASFRSTTNRASIDAQVERNRRRRPISFCLRENDLSKTGHQWRAQYPMSTIRQGARSRLGTCRDGLRGELSVEGRSQPATGQVVTSHFYVAGMRLAGCFCRPIAPIYRHTQSFARLKAGAVSLDDIGGLTRRRRRTPESGFRYTVNLWRMRHDGERRI